MSPSSSLRSGFPPGGPRPRWPHTQRRQTGGQSWPGMAEKHDDAGDGDDGVNDGVIDVRVGGDGFAGDLQRREAEYEHQHQEHHRQQLLEHEQDLAALALLPGRRSEW